MSEIADFATLVLVVAGGFAAAALSTRLTERVPVPAPALFLVAAAVVSDVWPAVYEHVPIRTVERIAVVALVVILFNGGIDIGLARLRGALAPVLSLGLAGTFLTAGGIAVVAHLVLGMDWTLAGLMGAALAPTDPAVMFSVLGRREIAGRSGTTLEGEAGMNDPAGIALMLGMIELATHEDARFWVVGREFAVEMAVGAAIGLLGARLMIPILRRSRLPSESLYPVLALFLAFVLYGAASAGAALATGRRNRRRGVVSSVASRHSGCRGARRRRPSSREERDPGRDQPQRPGDLRDGVSPGRCGASVSTTARRSSAMRCSSTSAGGCATTSLYARLPAARRRLHRRGLRAEDDRRPRLRRRQQCGSAGARAGGRRVRCHGRGRHQRPPESRVRRPRGRRLPSAGFRSPLTRTFVRRAGSNGVVAPRSLVVQRGEHVQP